MTKHEQKAAELFLSGYNCAQSVFCAFEDESELDHEFAMKLSSSFGGGMGRLREVCGALSSAFAIAGILWGYTDIASDIPKKEHYALIQELAAEFREEHKTIVCRELLTGLGVNSNPTPEPRTAEYYKKRPCVKFVMTAARLIDREIEKRSAEKR